MTSEVASTMDDSEARLVTSPEPEKSESDVAPLTINLSEPVPNKETGSVGTPDATGTLGVVGSDVLIGKEDSKKDIDSRELIRAASEKQIKVHSYPKHIQIFFTCKGLMSMNWFSKPDPLLALFIRDYQTGCFFELGRTNVVKDSLNPVFCRSICVNVQKVLSHIKGEVENNVRQRIDQDIEERRKLDEEMKFLDQSNKTPKQETLKRQKSIERKTKTTEELIKEMESLLDPELRIMVVDDDSIKHDISSEDIIGFTELKLKELLEAPQMMLTKSLIVQHRKFGSVTLRGEFIDRDVHPKSRVRMQIKGMNISKVDFFSESDPFLVISRTVSSHQFPIYVTEAKMNTANPYWKEIVMPYSHLCNGNKQCVITIDCFDYNLTGKKLIGTCSTTLEELEAEPDKPLTLKLGNMDRGKLFVMVDVQEFNPPKNAVLDLFLKKTVKPSN